MAPRCGPSLRDRLRPHVRAAAGHSLGEFTAHTVAGSFALADAARIVRRRGELMHQAGAEHPGTMAAILGDLSEPIDVICARASADPEGGVVVPANYNSAGTNGDFRRSERRGEGDAAVQSGRRQTRDAGST